MACIYAADDTASPLESGLLVYKVRILGAMIGHHRTLVLLRHLHTISFYSSLYNVYMYEALPETAV